MTEPTEGDVLDNLVTQFSSPLHCFRELVQNSIDAGSPVVEVWTEFLADEGHLGTIALHVDDFGEGMDEQIIDQQFTKLFASDKEKDLTKIGQFGIGFVSTFALEPEAVMVETGRAGEYWEVLFDRDRSFTKSRLDVPVEGTQITIFLEGDRHRYEELVDGIRTNLRHWCSQSDTEITFEDRSPADGSRPELETINEPFEVEGFCQTHVEHEGTQIVCAYSDDPVYGFYNRGLTLALTEIPDDVLDGASAPPSRFRHVACKIKSRYLEHTLSRDSVLRDENYRKAMELLERAVSGPLVENLVEALEDLVGREAWQLEEVARYGELVAFLNREPDEQIEKFGDRAILRTHDGAPMTLDEAYRTFRSDGRVLMADSSSGFVETLAEADQTVVLGEASESSHPHDLTAVCRLVRRYIERRSDASLLSGVVDSFRQSGFARVVGTDPDWRSEAKVASPEDVYLPVDIDETLPAAYEHWFESAGEALDDVGAGFDDVTTCVIDPEANLGGESAPFFVVGRRLGTMMARPPASVPHDRDDLLAAVNRQHPHFSILADLYERDADLGVYCLARALHLSARDEDDRPELFAEVHPDAPGWFFG